MQHIHWHASDSYLEVHSVFPYLSCKCLCQDQVACRILNWLRKGVISGYDDKAKDCRHTHCFEFFMFLKTLTGKTLQNLASSGGFYKRTLTSTFDMPWFCYLWNFLCLGSWITNGFNLTGEDKHRQQVRMSFIVVYKMKS